MLCALDSPPDAALLSRVPFVKAILNISPLVTPLPVKPVISSLNVVAVAGVGSVSSLPLSVPATVPGPPFTTLKIVVLSFLNVIFLLVELILTIEPSVGNCVNSPLVFDVNFNIPSSPTLAVYFSPFIVTDCPSKSFAISFALVSSPYASLLSSTILSVLPPAALAAAPPPISSLNVSPAFTVPSKSILLRSISNVAGFSLKLPSRRLIPLKFVLSAIRSISDVSDSISA